MDKYMELMRERLRSHGVKVPSVPTKPVVFGVVYRDDKLQVVCHGLDRNKVHERLICDLAGSDPWHTADCNTPDGGDNLARWIVSLGIKAVNGRPPKVMTDLMSEMLRIAADQYPIQEDKV